MLMLREALLQIIEQTHLACNDIQQIRRSIKAACRRQRGRRAEIDALPISQPVFAAPTLCGYDRLGIGINPCNQFTLGARLLLYDTLR